MQKVVRHRKIKKTNRHRRLHRPVLPVQVGVARYVRVDLVLRIIGAVRRHRVVTRRLSRTVIQRRLHQIVDAEVDRPGAARRRRQHVLQSGVAGAARNFCIINQIVSKCYATGLQC